MKDSFTVNFNESLFLKKKKFKANQKEGGYLQVKQNKHKGK